LGESLVPWVTADLQTRNTPSSYILPSTSQILVPAPKAPVKVEEVKFKGIISGVEDDKKRERRTNYEVWVSNVIPTHYPT